MLEKFLRKVSSLLFTSNLHPNSYEIALELQRFLDANPTGAISPEKTTKSKTEIFTKAIQCYCARIFLLPQLDSLIVQFIENCRANSPTNAQLIAMVNAKGHEELKRSAEQVSERSREKATVDPVIRLFLSFFEFSHWRCHASDLDRP